MISRDWDGPFTKYLIRMIIAVVIIFYIPVIFGFAKEGCELCAQFTKAIDADVNPAKSIYPNSMRLLIIVMPFVILYYAVRVAKVNPNIMPKNLHYRAYLVPALSAIFPFLVFYEMPLTKSARWIYYYFTTSIGSLLGSIAIHVTLGSGILVLVGLINVFICSKKS